MKILLDTHILLWALSDSPQLSDKARKIIMDEKNRLYYSTISLWEVELKHIVKPTQIPVSAKDIHSYCKDSGAYELIDMTLDDVLSFHQLKRKSDTPPHKDPFDRILLTQAINNKCYFMTHDFLITGYDADNIIHV